MKKTEDSFKTMEDKFQKTKNLRENYNKLTLYNDKNIKLILKIERFSGNIIEPDYTLSISEEGLVKYNGLKNVRTIGLKEFYIENEQLKNILHKLDTIYFFSLENCGISNISNNITVTKLSLTLEGDSKEILFANDNPNCSRLMEVTNYIYEIVKINIMV